jgi:hypothetical protein
MFDEDAFERELIALNYQDEDLQTSNLK